MAKDEEDRYVIFLLLRNIYNELPVMGSFEAVCEALQTASLLPQCACVEQTTQRACQLNNNDVLSLCRKVAELVFFFPPYLSVSPCLRPACLALNNTFYIKMAIHRSFVGF